MPNVNNNSKPSNIKILNDGKWSPKLWLYYLKKLESGFEPKSLGWRLDILATIQRQIKILHATEKKFLR